MTELRRIAGKTMMVGIAGPDLDRETSSRLAALGPGGAILFKRNLETPDGAQDLLSRLRAVLPSPAWFALDQEGGRVSRLERWIGTTPSASRLARAGAATVRRYAGATAAALRALGFNLDFAPVVDLCGEAATNGIGDRSFGEDADAATSLAGAFLDSLQRAGVAGCLKHFPGLGRTDVDSHELLPLAERTREELAQSELVPFERLAARAASVMVAHAAYPSLDPTPELPATLSRPIVTDLLRSRLRFAGLVVSDDLEMGAVAPLDENGSAAVRAIEAGCDMLLYCHRLDRAETAVEALVERARSDRAFEERLRSAALAVERSAGAWTIPDRIETSWAEAREELVACSALA